MLFISKHYGLTANGLSGQRMDLALNHVDMEFKNTNEQSYMNLKMVVLIVLAVFRRPNLVTFKIVQLIVNGQNGNMVHAPSHVEVANKSLYEQKKLKLKMEEVLALEKHQGFNVVIFKIVQLIANGQHGVRKVNAPDHVVVANKFL